MNEVPVGRREAFVCSILPTDMPQSGHNDQRNAGIRGANENLQKMAAEQGAIYVDYHSRMTREYGLRLREELADDGLHPHVLGYDIMAGALRETLEQKGIHI
ncbi:GDSL-type esterase/lipase family protein [Cohnella ginsengisoli]|uniref:GDSL-type esterase/lipase family protein n=2 Tax=Cohnella ginsengisoli TaxID=425004 RepID=A0A9X4KJ42_9BACL|nr:GDSL-type esterase/lipase family protein [Cohnella ginsengisoli]MDG0792913.1 GDSL-type esterase/lipase family protein [Cohnella ginsengisoli]